ncbi:MAG: hypothetical protein JNM58_14085 [Xanthomonadaceae bacterium]|nr:hypothetical protein [Xanthomonadaceae bacterium]
MSDDSLVEKVGDWLNRQGYPLEFSTAAAFHRAGFRTHQGLYVDDSESTREIDVVATQDLKSGRSLIRAEFVIECKWSVDKPWVVFASKHSRMAKSACVAQTLGSKAGRTVLWAKAGDEALHSIGIFDTPVLPGFGGRQAFSDNRDLVFDALKSVVSLSHSRAVEYDRQASSPSDHLDFVVMVFPVVVLKGRLFVAKYDEETGRMAVDEALRARIHWRGSDKWKLITTIDVVTEGQLEQYAGQVRKDVDALLPVMSESVMSLKQCVVSRDLSGWPVTSGPRGVAGRPSLLKEISQEISRK